MDTENVTYKQYYSIIKRETAIFRNMDNLGDHQAKQNNAVIERKMSHFYVESRFKVREPDIKREGGAGMRKASSGNSAGKGGEEQRRS